jgi:hypothetical protein
VAPRQEDEWTRRALKNAYRGGDQRLHFSTEGVIRRDRH